MLDILILAFRHNWKYFLGAALIVGGCYTIGNTIYNWGYKSSDIAWAERIADRDRIQAKQTLEIVNLSKAIKETSEALTAQSILNLDKIILTVKNKPLYTIVDGECNPSNVFENAYIGIIKEGKKK